MQDVLIRDAFPRGVGAQKTVLALHCIFFCGGWYIIVNAKLRVANCSPQIEMATCEHCAIFFSLRKCRAMIGYP